MLDYMHSIQHLLLIIAHDLNQDLDSIITRKGRFSAVNEMDRIIAIAYNRALRDQRQTKGSWFLQRSILDGDHCQRRKNTIRFPAGNRVFIRKDFFRCSCQHSIYPRLAKSWFKEVCEWNICFLQGKEVFADERKGKAMGFLKRLADGIIAAWSVVLRVSVNPDNIIAKEKKKKHQEKGGIKDISERGECWSSSSISEVRNRVTSKACGFAPCIGSWHAYIHQ